MSSELKSLSKYLSYILRHHPESIGIEVDSQGWAHLPSLIEKSHKQGREISRSKIKEVIAQNSKQRFTISDDGEYIRAGYGHSIDVDLGLEPRRPPEHLYHGTAAKNLPSIKAKGLHPQSRNMVHLSAEKEDAKSVGGRHGKPVILTIRARYMYTDGHPFYQSESEPGIWMVEAVPVKYIEVERPA